MTNIGYDKLKMESLVNDDLAPLGDARAGVGKASAAHASRIAREQAAYKPLSVAERAARGRLQAARQQAAPNGEEQENLVRNAFASHYRLRDLNEESLILIDRALPADDNFPTDIGVIHPATVDIGMWWWGQRNLWVPNTLLGLTVFVESDGLHFRGQLDRDEGDLWFGSAGVNSIYGIGSDRLPPQGWYRSVPRVNLWGEVWGFTGVNGPLSFGDNWSKCWLHANQKIKTEDGATIAESHWYETVLSLDGEGHHGVCPLPGTFTFPEVFVFVVPDRPLIAELELKFDIQLEGDSTFRFGNYAGWTDALFQAPQWSLVP